jgi:uncharacterized damage-inducible protein DinB
MSAAPTQPEVWLRGPVVGVCAPLQPVAHALLQALEDAERLTSDLQPADLWLSLGGAASVGFHLRHMTGSLDRLLTYARGETLSQRQHADLGAEQEPEPEMAAHELLERLGAVTRQALAQLSSTDEDVLDDHRSVGRLGHPSTVRGLLCHAGEHTARHAGQISTTVRLLRDHTTADLEQRLLSREEDFWRGDAEFFRQNLSDDSLLVFAEPIGVLTKGEAVESIDGSARWSDLNLQDARVLRLAPHAVMMTYRADARRDDGSSYSALVSSGYVRADGGWQLAFHQQTPVG